MPLASLLTRLCQRFPLVVDEPCNGIGDAALGVIALGLDLHFKFCWQHSVVAVEVLDEFTTCDLPSGLPR